MKPQVWTLCLGVMLWAGLGAASTKDIVITDPRIPERPPVAKMLAAYMTITNTTATPRQLLSVASPDFKQIEIHQTTMHNGMAHMAAQASLPVPANSKVILAPGGLHLMLIQPLRQLRAGDTVMLNLMFDDSAALAVTVPVVKQNIPEK